MDGIDVVDGDDTNHRGDTTENEVGVSTHRSSPDRVVFTEESNCDGWIAIDADAAVSIDR